MGLIPHPTTTRTLFMNSFLPEFYNAKYKYCKNSKHFVKQFHGTGRQLYQSKQQIDGLEKLIDSMMNKENPAAAGAVFDSDYPLVPSDDIIIANNIEKAKQLTSKLSSLHGDIKNMDSKLFITLGKLTHGEEATHKIFEQPMGKIAILQTRVRDINNNLMELKEKCSRLFTVQYSKPKSQKKKQKQNKRKAAKVKVIRMEENCKRVIETIAPQHQSHDVTERIGPLSLHYEGISGLLKKQKPYIQFAFEKRLFIKEAQNIIKQYLCFNLNENDDDESGYISADDINDDDEDAHSSIDGDAR